MTKVHFLGINGSGIIGVACMAKQEGFDVDGCDISESGNYSQQLKELNIHTYVGHNVEHLKNKDYLVVSPAIYFNDKYKTIEEVCKARELGVKELKWQTFLDRFLANNKIFITVCGTHGKTSTTTFVSNLLENAGLDPSCIIGGMNPKWNANFRTGKGKYFVCEADEYAHNFHEYHPNYIILNNVEMEHPEFFNNYDEYEKNFIDFLHNIKDNGTIIFNCDDINSLDVIGKIKDFAKEHNITIFGFTSSNFDIENDFIKHSPIKIINEKEFILDGEKYTLKNVNGRHNIYNLSAVILLAKALGIPQDVIKDNIENAFLPKRRMEKIFDNEHIKIFDDYAHHHSQIFYNLSTLKNTIKDNEKIIAVLEPHLISRFRDNSKEFLDYMEIADYSIITKFFKSREEKLPDLDMNYYLKDRKTKYIEKFDDVVKEVKDIVDNNPDNTFYIVVMGAGLSYKLSQQLKQQFI